MKIQKRLDKGLKQLKFFMTNQWSFHDTNVRNLLYKMSVIDRDVFQIDTNVIQWDMYMENYCLGIRNNLLKQNENSLKNCQNRMKRLVVLIINF